MRPFEYLGEYPSIWREIDDPLEKELIGQEIRKNHRRSIKEIRRVVRYKYWIQVFLWVLQDMRVYVPLFGFVSLGLLLMFIALR